MKRKQKKEIKGREKLLEAVHYKWAAVITSSTKLKWSLSEWGE
jgi:hypothetical protein